MVAIRPSLPFWAVVNRFADGSEAKRRQIGALRRRPSRRSVEIARSPEDVFAYIADVSRHSESQEGLVSATVEGEGLVRVGSRVVHRRNLRPPTVATTSEITAFKLPGTRGSQRVEPTVLRKAMFRQGRLRCSAKH
jgi:hypothetical protein